MDTDERRSEIIKKLEGSKKPISASSLSKSLKVSRQIIVGDVAILRASGKNIVSTPKGYLLENSNYDFPYVGIVACKHDMEGLKKELYAIVDLGGTIIDVTVDHNIYGQLSGKLNISSRYDADLFIKKVQKNNAKPLSNLTGGIHIHQIGCKSHEIFGIIKNKLNEIGVKL